MAALSKEEAALAQVQTDLRKVAAKVDAVEDKMRAVEDAVRPLEEKEDAGNLSQTEEKKLDRWRLKEAALLQEKAALQQKEVLLLEKERDLRRRQERLESGGGPYGDNSPSSSSTHNSKVFPGAVRVSCGSLQFGDAAQKWSRMVHFPAVWSLVKDANAPCPRLGGWISESDLQGFVKVALTDIRNVLFSAGHNFDIFAEKSVTSLRPDLFLLRDADSAVVGFVEVKKPEHRPGKKSVMDSVAAHRKVAAYLALLYLMGCSRPIGILSTYEKWRVFWLDVDISHDDDGRDENKEESAFSVKMERKIWKRDDGKLGRHLALVLIEMLHQSPRSSAKQLEAVDVPQGLRPLNSSGLVLVPKGGLCWRQLSTHPLVAGEYALDRFLGSGLHGKVWRVLDHAGALHVLKFAAQNDRNSEKAGWAAQGVDLTEFRLSRNSTAVVMPLVDCIPSVEFLDDDGALLKQCRSHFDSLVQKGVVHSDLRMRHVGRIKQGEEGRGRLVFIDFGNCDDPDDDDAVEKAWSKFAELVKESRSAVTAQAIVDETSMLSIQ